MNGIRWIRVGVCLTGCALAAAAPTPVSAQTAQTETAARLGDSRRLARESVEAYRAGDFATFGVKNDSALALRPDHPTLVYNRAAARALANDTAGSVQSLSHLASWGLAYDPAADADFEALHGAPAFEGIRDSLLGNGQPRGRAERAVVLADSAMIPEGLAYDAATESFIVSGVRHRIVLRVSRDGGSVSRIVDGAATGMLPPLGLAIDPARRSLWLSGTLVEESAELAGDENGPDAEVREYDLDSGELRRVVAVPVGNAAAGDLALAPDGSVLVSDWRRGALLRAVPGSDTLEEVLSPGTLGSPQGIVPLRDGSGAWVADYALGLVFVDFRDASVDVVRTWTTLLGADGLVGLGDDLLVVQNGVAPARVLHVRLSGDRRHAEDVSVILAAHEDFSGPTGITVAEGMAYVIANGQWSKFAGGEERSAELRCPIVLRLESAETKRGP